MKCPRCGSEMTLDDHRKIPLEMCYNCGYIEGQGVEPEKKSTTNFEHMKDLNFNELASFMAKGLGLDTAAVADWLDDQAKLIN